MSFKLFVISYYLNMNDTTVEERNENYSPYTPLPPQEQKTPNHFILFQASLSVCSQWNFFFKNSEYIINFIQEIKIQILIWNMKFLRFKTISKWLSLMSKHKSCYFSMIFPVFWQTVIVPQSFNKSTNAAATQCSTNEELQIETYIGFKYWCTLCHLCHLLWHKNCCSNWVSPSWDFMITLYPCIC